MIAAPALNLDAAELADFTAAAKAQGVTPATLAARIVREWLGPARVVRDDARAVAARRLAMLREWWDGRTPTGASKATLYNWQLRYQARGLAGLADLRFDPRRRPDPFEAFRQELVRVYRSKRRASLRTCYDAASAAARRHAWPIPSYRSAARTLAPLQGGKGKGRSSVEGRSIGNQTRARRRGAAA